MSEDALRLEKGLDVRRQLGMKPAPDTPAGAAFFFQRSAIGLKTNGKEGMQ